MVILICFLISGLNAQIGDLDGIDVPANQRADLVTGEPFRPAPVCAHKEGNPKLNFITIDVGDVIEHKGNEIAIDDLAYYLMDAGVCSHTKVHLNFRDAPNIEYATVFRILDQLSAVGLRTHFMVISGRVVSTIVIWQPIWLEIGVHSRCQPPNDPIMLLQLVPGL